MIRLHLKIQNIIKKFQITQSVFSIPIYFIVVCLIFPFIFFSFRLETLLWPQMEDFLSVFFITTFQASLSALLSLIFGILGACGLLHISNKKYYFFIEALVVVPCLMPPLLLALSVINLTDTFIPFPFGLTALIFTQVISYIGLCSVIFTRIFLKEVSHLSELAYLYGSSFFVFLKTLLKTILLQDIKNLFIVIFAACFTGLSLPLLVSGNPNFSLEFFIYENLKDFDLWPQAMSLILFQSIFIFLICWYMLSGKTSLDLVLSFKKIYILPKARFLCIPFMALFFSLGGLFFISYGDLFKKLFAIRDVIIFASINSLILGLSVGAIVLLALIFISLSFQNIKLRKFIASYLPPGSSFIALVFLFYSYHDQQAVMIKWILGLSLLLFPVIYRFRGEKTLEKLSQQVQTARFLGADWFLIFYKILWPQSRSIFFLCAGVASFWACGDFAYSLIVSAGHSHLSLLVYDIFSSYRLDEAILLSWLLICLSFFVFLFWLGASFVFDKKLILQNR